MRKTPQEGRPIHTGVTALPAVLSLWHPNVKTEPLITPCIWIPSNRSRSSFCSDPLTSSLSPSLSTQAQASRPWVLQEPMSLGRNGISRHKGTLEQTAPRRQENKKFGASPGSIKQSKTILGSVRPCFNATTMNKSLLGCLENINTTQCSCS